MKLLLKIWAIGWLTIALAWLASRLVILCPDTAIFIAQILAVSVVALLIGAIVYVVLFWDDALDL